MRSSILDREFAQGTTTRKGFAKLVAVRRRAAALFVLAGVAVATAVLMLPVNSSTASPDR